MKDALRDLNTAHALIPKVSSSPHSFFSKSLMSLLILLGRSVISSDDCNGINERTILLCRKVVKRSEPGFKLTLESAIEEGILADQDELLLE